MRSPLGNHNKMTCEFFRKTASASPTPIASAIEQGKYICVYSSHPVTLLLWSTAIRKYLSPQQTCKTSCGSRPGKCLCQAGECCFFSVQFQTFFMPNVSPIPFLQIFLHCKDRDGSYIFWGDNELQSEEVTQVRLAAVLSHQCHSTLQSNTLLLKTQVYRWNSQKIFLRSCFICVMKMQLRWWSLRVSNSSWFQCCWLESLWNHGISIRPDVHACCLTVHGCFSRSWFPLSSSKIRIVCSIKLALQRIKQGKRRQPCIHCLWSIVNMTIGFS